MSLTILGVYLYCLMGPKIMGDYTAKLNEIHQQDQ